MDELDLIALFNRELYTSFQDQFDPTAESPFYTSGAFTNNSAITRALTSGQPVVVIPHVGDLDANIEPNYSNTVFTDIAEPEVLTGGKVKARVAYLNKGFRTSALTKELTSNAPNEAIARRLNSHWARVMERRAIATTYGLYNALKADAALKGDYIVDAGTTGFDVNAFIDTEALLTASNQGSGVMVVSPQVHANMRKQRLIERVATSDNLGSVEVYNGRIVIVAETDPKTKSNWARVGAGKDAKNLTIIVDDAAFVADMVANVRDMRVESTEATGNGGGHDTLWSRKNALIHPQGFDFIAKDEELTGGTSNEALSASLDDLANGKFWKVNGQSNIRFLISA